MRVYFTVASYWLIADFTSMTRATVTALKYTIPVNLYLVVRAIREHTKLIYQQTEIVMTDPRPPSEKSR